MNFREPIQRLKKMKDRELVKMASDTGLSIWTLRAIRGGRTTDPKLDTVELIQGYLERTTN